MNTFLQVYYYKKKTRIEGVQKQSDTNFTYIKNNFKKCDAAVEVPQHNIAVTRFVYLIFPL